MTGSCASSPGAIDTSLEGLALTSVNPVMVLPGSVLEIAGTSFVDTPWGHTTLHMQGTVEVAGDSRDLEVQRPVRFVDFDHLHVDVDDAFFDAFGAAGADANFDGEIWVVVESTVNGKSFETGRLTQSLSLRRELAPRLDSVLSTGVIFVNDAIAVSGDGILLSDGEGTTYAVLSGCFTVVGETQCNDIGERIAKVYPDTTFGRTDGSFAFAPTIAGIRPGRFEGTVHLRNENSKSFSTSASHSVQYDLTSPVVFAVSPTSASLGQYVDVSGGGFVGADGATTVLRLQGIYTPTGSPSGAPVNMWLIPEFVDGRTVRYVLNEDDALGRTLDLRTATGTFGGAMTPEISYGGADVVGTATDVSFSIAPVKQVVHMDFSGSYVESLRGFGLRAADSRIRLRVIEVVERDYRTVNLEVRDQSPTDFAYYVQVEIRGPDPNGLGLFGYDNSPGKDNGNQRLWDRIGGVNATTQQDGFPGYGGVFIESLFGFSQHPGDHGVRLPGADPLFDAIFDPFRPDREGSPVRAADLSGIGALTDSSGCPAEERSQQLACAIWVIGSLIGTTVSHEIGHSLGLANPYGEGFHNTGDVPNRLMESGAGRSFAERAELSGEGPSRFCGDEYEYLRQILPTNEPDDSTGRPDCH